MADSNLGPRWRNLARVVRGERSIRAGAVKTLDALLSYVGSVLASSGYDAGVLDPKSAKWAHLTDQYLLPPIEGVFVAAYDAETRAPVTAAAAPVVGDKAATSHLLAVENRLRDVPDDVFDVIRKELIAGRDLGESIPQLAARVDALLTDADRWANRATLIARTEVLTANRAGGLAASAANAALFGYTDADVQKTWLATLDDRTRPAHADMDGTSVFGVDTEFTPEGEPGQVFPDQPNCRCDVLYSYPGDPDYEGDATPAVTGDESGVNDIPANVAPSLASQIATGVAVGRALEHVTDQGPTSAQEHTARQMTLDELTDEARNGKGAARTAARAELRRRGFPGVASGRIKAALAAGGQEQTMAENPKGLTAALDAEAVHGDLDGVLVVLLPAADDPVQGIGPETKHVSVLMYGDADEVTQEADGNGHYGPDFRTVLESTVAGYAGIIAPFSDAVTGVESLGDNGARVWMLDPGGRCSYVEGDLPDYESEVTPPPSEYPEYLPHVTIGYPDPEVPEEQEGSLVPEVEEAAAQVTSIKFDRIAVWWAGEQTEWTLTGDAAEEAPVDDQTTETSVHQGVLEAFARHLSNAGADYDETLASLQSIDLAALPLVAAEGDPLPGPEGQPSPAGEDAPAAASDISTDGPPLYGILWPEGVQSGDARAIAVGATTWRDLPLPLMAQEATAMGHDGAVRVARIDTIDRDEATYSVPVIRYTGTWDTSPAAAETMRQVEAGILRGLSVDGDAVTVELRGSDGAPLDPMVDDFPDDGVVVEVATAARVAGATGCSVPAFQQAYVSNGTLADRAAPEPGWNEDGTPKDNVIGEPPEGVTEVGDQPQTEPAVAASGAPMAPAWSLTASAGPVWSASDFANPGLTEPTRLTVTDDGRVYGHLATWGVCHIGIDGICQEPPISATNYAYFATGQVPTDQGWASVGQLTMETGHAGMQLGAKAAVSHYDNTGTGVADVSMGQDSVGIWFAGRLRPGTTPEQVYAMRAVGSVSGDWREVGGNLELVAGLVCNVPGFPIPAPSIAASGARPVAMVASGVVHPDAEAVRRGSDLLLTMADVQSAVETVLASRERYSRAATAATRLRSQRATLAQRRLDAFAAYQRKTRATAAAARLTTTTRGGQ